MEVGIRNSIKMTVTERDTARSAGSGTLEVFATPAMIALMEKTCYEAVQPYLDEGQSTVGTKLDVAHISATPVGMTVVSECVLTEIDGRRLIFSVEAKDETGPIGKGIHERFIINCDRFYEKASAKLNK